MAVGENGGGKSGGTIRPGSTKAQRQAERQQRRDARLRSKSTTL